MRKVLDIVLKIGSIVKSGASLFTPANIIGFLSLIKDLKNLWRKAQDSYNDYQLNSYHKKKAKLEGELNEAIAKGDGIEIERLHIELVTLERLWKQSDDKTPADN